MLVEATRDPEVEALAVEVDRVVGRVLLPAVARPEIALDEGALGRVLAELEALGVAGTDDAPSGLAPWESLEAGAPTGPSLDLLRRLALADAGVALAIHQRALSRVVARVLGLAPLPPRTAIAVEGTHGLGREALARWLAGGPLDSDDHALLRDDHASDGERVLVLEPTPLGLLRSTFDDGAFAFELHPADALSLARVPFAHGLDSLALFRVRPRAAPQGSARVDPAWFATFLAADQLARVAIAHGAATRALRLARAFAAQRRQGGRTIDGHPAVLALLGKAGAVVSAITGQLDALGARPLRGVSSLASTLACRAEAMPALADAAHATLQTFGGLGYLRDTGLERVARDVNALRVTAGSPTELGLVVAELARLHA